MTLGATAEFIIENQSPPSSPAFTDFTDIVRMTGIAASNTGSVYTQTISTDSLVYLLTDFTNTTTHLSVWLGSFDETYFSITPN
jgi:hypothetical protein